MVSFTSHAQSENEGPLFDVCMISEINKSNDEVPVGELRKICKKKPSSPLEEKLRLEKAPLPIPLLFYLINPIIYYRLLIQKLIMGPILMC